VAAAPAAAAVSTRGFPPPCTAAGLSAAAASAVLSTCGFPPLYTVAAAVAAAAAGAVVCRVSE